MSDRGPGRLPGLLTNGTSHSSSSSMTSEDCNGYDGDGPAVNTSAMTELLRQRLGMGNGDVMTSDSCQEDGSESLLDYDPDDDEPAEAAAAADDEFGEEDEIVFDVVDDDKAGGEQGERDKFKTPECLIKTSATIVVHKRECKSGEAGDGEQRPTLSQVCSRQLLICVPPSRMKEPLSRRFENQNQRMMKRDLTPEQKLLNYLRFRGEAGFSKAFSGTAGAKAKLEERIKLLEASGAKPTVYDKFLARQADDNFDHEGFWREQVAVWIMKYEWRRREGPEVSKDELDREIEEWMNQRGKAFQTEEEMEQDLTNFMSKKGFDKEEREKLDDDMDEYWKKKDRLPQTDDDTDDTSTVTSVQTFGSRRAADYSEQDLDNDLQNYINKRGQSASSSVAGGDTTDNNSMDTDEDASASSKSSSYDALLIPNKTKLTPAERMKRASGSRCFVQANAGTTPRSAYDLDQDLDGYFARQKMLDERVKTEEEERRRQEEEEADRAAVGDGDKFDDIDEELEWQT